MTICRDDGLSACLALTNSCLKLLGSIYCRGLGNEAEQRPSLFSTIVFQTFRPRYIFSNLATLCNNDNERWFNETTIEIPDGIVRDMSITKDINTARVGKCDNPNQAKSISYTCRIRTFGKPLLTCYIVGITIPETVSRPARRLRALCGIGLREIQICPVMVNPPIVSVFYKFIICAASFSSLVTHTFVSFRSRSSLHSVFPSPST